MNKTLVQSVDSSEANKAALQKSATLNRKYVKRPIISVQSVMLEREAKSTNLSSLAENVEQADLQNFRPKISIPISQPAEADEVPIPEQEEKPLKKIAIEQAEESSVAEAFETPDQPAAPNPFQAAIDRAAAAKEPEEVSRPSSIELKNEAIKKALEVMEEQKEEQAVSKVIREEKHADELKAAKAKTVKAPKLAKKQKKSVIAPAKTVKAAKVAKTTKPARSVRKSTARAAMPKMAKSGSVISKVAKNSVKEPESLAKTFKRKKYHSGSKFFLAFTCSAACVAVLAYFVNLNMPTISVRVAAMQTGIEASYPSYIPRDYSLGNVTSDKDDKINMSFHGTTDDQTFVITEEKSSWDSNALLNNFVKPTWGTDYTTIREQGITIYVYGSNAAWVNGGILYKITTDSANLSKKQIKNIVTSL